MPVNILMPALSPTMTEGTLAKWHVKEGDEVNAGDVIAEIETDKATMEVEAVDEGHLGEILVPEGTESVPVNQPIAVLLQEGESESDLGQATSAPPPPAEDAPASAPSGEKASKAPEAPAKGGAPGTQEMLKDAPPAPPAPKSSGGERIFASPLARRMAKQAGIDLTQIKGSGPNSRIVRADVEQAIERGVSAPAEAAPAKKEAAPAAAAAPAAEAPAAPRAKDLADSYGLAYEEVPLSSMRRTIAKRMVEAKQSIPDYPLTVDVEIGELLRVRKELNARAEKSGADYKLSVNDFIVRACALALMQVPGVNASYNGTTLLMYDHADISVAVAIEGGLITPIVKKADTKGLAQISREMKVLAKRARDGKLKPEDYQGGTFSLSNLGMMGIKEFGAIINPPQGCIVAVGQSEQRPVVKDGALAVATMMSVTGTFDHRVADGAMGAEFMGALKKLLEDPLTMML